jgi:hypothetical protein
MTSDRGFVAYLAWFTCTAVALLLTAISLSLFFRPLAGDLTRIGKWPERYFGPTLPQPLPAVRTNGPSLTHQQILVLGDSFSHPNIWQSYLAESNKLDILSFEFKDVGCIDNWVNWVVAQPVSEVKTVIIELAERSFVAVLKNQRSCVSSIPPASAATDKTRAGNFVQGITLDAAYLTHTAANTLRMSSQAGDISSGDVINVPLSNSKLFSNSRSSRLLYYAEDDSKKLWTEQDIAAAIANLKRIRARLGALRLIVVVVPDKSTVYRSYMSGAAGKARYPDASAYLAASGIDTVDLFSLFRGKVAGEVDLYLPNDTHLGANGYRLMATAVAARLQSTAGK